MLVIADYIIWKQPLSLMRTIDVHFSAILFVNMLLKVQKVFEQKVDMQEITIDHMQRGRTSVNAPRLVL